MEIVLLIAFSAFEESWVCIANWLVFVNDVILSMNPASDATLTSAAVVPEVHLSKMVIQIF